MEAKSSEDRKWWKLIPSYGQLLWGIGGMLITIGITYAQVQSNTKKLDSLSDSQVKTAEIVGEISNLHYQIEQANKTQEQTNLAVIDLTKSVNELGNAVSRLEGRIDDTPIKTIRKK